MKHLLKITLIIFALGLLVPKIHASFPSDFKVVTIKTSAICGSCKSRIEKALKATDGVEEAILNLNNKQVKIKYLPSKTSPEKLREVISNVGYSADELAANSETYNNLPNCCKKSGLCKD